MRRGRRSPRWRLQILGDPVTPASRFFRTRHNRLMGVKGGRGLANQLARNRPGGLLTMNVAGYILEGVPQLRRVDANSFALMRDNRLEHSAILRAKLLIIAGIGSITLGATFHLSFPL